MPCQYTIYKIRGRGATNCPVCDQLPFKCDDIFNDQLHCVKEILKILDICTCCNDLNECYIYVTPFRRIHVMYGTCS